MYVKSVVIKNKTGLHARPAAEFVGCAKRYSSDIRVRRPGAVSYTHLDVYKRQTVNRRPRPMISLGRVRNDCIDSGGREADSRGDRVQLEKCRALRLAGGGQLSLIHI